MKALALLSGGLDSALAVKLVQQQGVDVVAVNFLTPFCLCGRGGCGASGVAKQLGIPLKVIRAGEEYLRMLRNPKYGYGRNMNPCIDCRIFMLERAKELMKEVGASFLFTGEVLNERPMSQHRKALETIEAAVGLKGMILRPLSARVLPETEAEKRGWINRTQLLDISGRSRKKQIQLAEEFSIKDYPCPAGGCLLTCKEFAAKLRDSFAYQKEVTFEDVRLLKIGRHFRFGLNKVIVGRDETENQELKKLKAKSDYCFEVPDCGSPITLLQGRKTKAAIMKAAALTLRYSDYEGAEGMVQFGAERMDDSIAVSAMETSEIEESRVK